MGKVVGLGGIFVHLKGETKELYDWYEKNLGLDMTEYGTGFLEGEQLVLISLKRNQENAPFLNFRVDELNEIITRLKTMNITIISDVTPYTYGLFATFMDPFGNAIELWEPYVDAYKEMVLKEISDYKLKKKT